MAFCQQCGTKLSPGARYCATCETMCEAQQEEPTPSALVDFPRRTQTPPPFSGISSFREIASRLEAEKSIQFRYDEGNTTFPASAITAYGKVSVENLLPSLAAELPDRHTAPMVTLTARDLAKSGCGSLFGYADPSRGICVVSTARLGATIEEIAPRLENVIRHELGHLEGLRHCHERGCLMEAAMKPENLDCRRGSPCSECCRKLQPLSSRLRHRVAAALLLLAVLVSMNLVATLLEPAPHEPFTFSPTAADADPLAGDPASEHRLIFDGTPLIESSLVTNPEVAAAELNRLFQLIEPPKLRTTADNSGNLASVISGEHEILRIHDPEAPARAGRIATKLNTILESKGTQSSRCANCHRDRKDEVIYAAAQRQAGFGIGPF